METSWLGRGYRVLLLARLAAVLWPQPADFTETSPEFATFACRGPKGPPALPRLLVQWS